MPMFVLIPLAYTGILIEWIVCVLGNMKIQVFHQRVLMRSEPEEYLVKTVYRSNRSVEGREMKTPFSPISCVWILGREQSRDQMDGRVCINIDTCSECINQA